MKIWTISFTAYDEETLREVECTMTTPNGIALYDSEEKAQASCDKYNKIDPTWNCHPKELFVM